MLAVALLSVQTDCHTSLKQVCCVRCTKYSCKVGGSMLHSFMPKPVQCHMISLKFSLCVPFLIDLLYCNCMHLTLCIYITEVASCQLLSLHAEEGIRQNVCTCCSCCITKLYIRYTECELQKRKACSSIPCVPRNSWKFN